MTCPKCGAVSGDAWLQCDYECPIPMSPWFSEECREKVQADERRAAQYQHEEPCT